MAAFPPLRRRNGWTCSNCEFFNQTRLSTGCPACSHSHGARTTSCFWLDQRTLRTFARQRGNLQPGTWGHSEIGVTIGQEHSYITRAIPNIYVFRWRPFSVNGRRQRHVGICYLYNGSRLSPEQLAEPWSDPIGVDSLPFLPRQQVIQPSTIPVSTPRRRVTSPDTPCRLGLLDFEIETPIVTPRRLSEGVEIARRRLPDWFTPLVQML
ncbi:hypothetical protein EJ08DRAFT_694127 [Tothia fuscella]|uniref:Uncharacterized protein n=1 Tax=Tothia fuscella TaxID=1048955 RepID=A0A9P4U222_9PEZI|nr:hypothetical protein EJ08DRAFT_694127 [Tothia fuscella]